MLGRIRALEGAAGSKMPAIALTAYARASDRERALAAGFQHHVVKPVDPQHLVSILSAALAR
jgi:CheY-like chemotaxis protein